MRSIEGGIQAYLRDPAVNNTGVLSGTQMNRFVNGFLDLFTITFITRFGKKPMHIFGLLGSLSFLLGMGLTAWMIVSKLFFDTAGRLIADRAEFYIALVAMIIGVQLFLAGFVAELVSRNSSIRNNYLIEKEI